MNDFRIIGIHIIENYLLVQKLYFARYRIICNNIGNGKKISFVWRLTSAYFVQSKHKSIFCKIWNIIRVPGNLYWKTIYKYIWHPTEANSNLRGLIIKCFWKKYFRSNSRLEITKRKLKSAFVKWDFTYSDIWEGGTGENSTHNRGGLKNY